VPRTARVVVEGASRDVDLGSHRGLTLQAEVDAPASGEEAAIVYTSGFEGTPLGAMLTHANLLSNARATVAAAQMDRDVTALAVLPFAHLFGLVVSGVAPALAGGRVTTMARFNPARVVSLLEQGGISDLVGVPSVFATVVALAKRRGTRLRASALRLCICGGAPLAVELQDRWFELTGVELRQGYGLTEAGPVCLFNRIDLPNRRGTLGVPFPGVHVSIRAERSENEVAMGETGEICVSGPNVFAGYITAAGVRPTSAKPWAAGLRRSGPWLRTGDLGVRNADGTASFHGVIKPMFTRNGFNIYPREIERVVREMPGVESVRARPVPDPLRENDIAIDVRGDVDAADVKRWCDERLSVYKRPTSIKVVPVT
jgi:long-chain acyl-CoA synthetase